MPELPDVEGFRRVLAAHEGHRIDRVDVIDSGALRDVDAERLTTSINALVFAGPRRHGKRLIGPLRQRGTRHLESDPTLVMHFGMTGLLLTARAGSDRHTHDRVIFVTDSEELRYRDQRKLQGIRLVDDDAHLDALMADLGPDAATVDQDDLCDRLRNHDRQLKAALMDQSLIAGLGNLTVDEVLWRACVHPSRSSRTLSAPEQERIHTELGRVLRYAMADGQIPTGPGWLTGVRDSTSPSCPGCGTPLRNSRISGRRTLWCPRCQQAPVSRTD